MIIRPYTEADFEGIKRVIHSIQTEECWPHYYPKGENSTKIRNEFEPMRSYKDSIFLVSEAKGQITGLIAGHDLDSFIEHEIPHLKTQLDEQGLYKSNTFFQQNIIIHKSYL